MTRTEPYGALTPGHERRGDWVCMDEINTAASNAEFRRESLLRAPRLMTREVGWRKATPSGRRKPPPLLYFHPSPPWLDNQQLTQRDENQARACIRNTYCLRLYCAGDPPTLSYHDHSTRHLVKVALRLCWPWATDSTKSSKAPPPPMQGSRQLHLEKPPHCGLLHPPSRLSSIPRRRSLQTPYPPSRPLRRKSTSTSSSSSRAFDCST